MDKTEQSNKLRIASLPGRPLGFDGIPYINLFYDALLPHGIEQTMELLPTAAWLRQHHAEIDIVHLHWPEKIWRGEYTFLHRRAQALRGYYYFRKWLKPVLFPLGMRDLRNFLKACKVYDIKVVWTLHELTPHSSAGKIDKDGYALLANSSDMIISHSDCASQQFISLYGNADKLVLMKHGNFRTAYPAPRPRQQVLSELGLDPQFPTVCLLGALRKYKGIELALEAVMQISEHVQLIIGGVPLGDFPLEKTIDQVKQLPKARIIPRPLSPQEFADLAAASDAFLLPYQQITTSGVMHAAFTFGCGIVATKLPYFEETMAVYPSCGCLAKSNSAEDFAQAILDFFQIPKSQRSKEIENINQQSEWKIVIQPVAEKFRQWF